MKGLHAKDYYIRNRRRIIAQTKMRKVKCRELNNQLKMERGGKCSACGYSDLRALTWHHIRDKKYGVAALAGQGKTNMLKEEVQKCILLCANCHMILHVEEERERNARSSQVV